MLASSRSFAMPLRLARPRPPMPMTAMLSFSFAETGAGGLLGVCTSRRDPVRGAGEGDAAEELATSHFGFLCGHFLRSLGWMSQA